VFTRWINVKLRTGQSKMQIHEDELLTCWADGVKLAEFLKVLSHQDHHEKLKEGLTARIHKVDQVKRVLDFAWKVGVKCELKPSVENIIDASEIQIMGFIWAIMRSFLKIGDGHDDDRLSAQEALLMWVRNTTAGYPGVDVKNFTKSWHDGLAFCALIHKFRPKLIGDWKDLSPSNGVANIKRAMDAATAWFGMEQYLEPGDIEILDDKSMVIYVSEWYFGITGQKDIFLAANRIGKLIDYTEKNDQLKNEYNERAAKLKQEIVQARGLLETPSIDNLDNAKARIEAFEQFAQKKASLTDEFLSIENHFNELAMRLADQQRPNFQPAEGLSIPELRQDFVFLDKQTQEVKSAWHSIKLRLEHRYGVAANDFARWLKYVSAEAETTSFGFTLDEMKAFDLDGADSKVLDEMQTRKRTCDEAYAVLRDLGVTSNRFTHETPETLNKGIDALKAALSARRQRHSDEVSLKTTIESLCQDFANLANPFAKAIESSKDNVTNSQAELAAQLATVVGLIASAPAEQKAGLEKLHASQAKIDHHGVNLNTFTFYTVQDLEVLSKQYLVFLAQKKTMLEDLIERKKMRGVTKEQYALFQKQFKEFDKNGNGHLDANELRQCLFSLGESRKKEEVDGVMKQYGDGKEILFDGYVEFMLNTVGDKATKEDTVAGFLKITKGEEAARMENLSDVFDAKQMEYIKNTAPRTADGRLDFRAWVDQMFSR